uniref:Uncharacterized protein n=1 Tax=Monodelphis domestica TaxID=13616 RepID=A0A5F8H3H5_MONDO
QEGWGGREIDLELRVARYRKRNLEDKRVLKTSLPTTESHDPRTDEVIKAIHQLLQAHKIAKEELWEIEAKKEALKKELDELTSEETHLEELLKSKQESLRILQQHNREKESKMLRKQAMAQDSLQKITELNSKIQEDKVKKKKLRMEFEQQLEELMEQHKTLWELHVREISWIWVGTYQHDSGLGGGEAEVMSWAEK